MEKVEGGHLPLSADVVTLPIKPYEILTVQVFYPSGASAGAGQRRAVAGADAGFSTPLRSGRNDR
jgi:hypothetical protein